MNSIFMTYIIYTITTDNNEELSHIKRSHLKEKIFKILDESFRDTLSLANKARFNLFQKFTINREYGAI